VGVLTVTDSRSCPGERDLLHQGQLRRRPCPPVPPGGGGGRGNGDAGRAGAAAAVESWRLASPSTGFCDDFRDCSVMARTGGQSQTTAVLGGARRSTGLARASTLPSQSQRVVPAVSADRGPRARPASSRSTRAPAPRRACAASRPRGNPWAARARPEPIWNLGSCDITCDIT
jgi:hypothetical protein